MAAAFVLGEVYAAGYIMFGVFLGLLLAAALFYDMGKLFPILPRYSFMIWELVLTTACLLGGFYRFSEEEYRRSCIEAVAEQQAGEPVNLQAEVTGMTENAYGVTLTLSRVQLQGKETGLLKLYAYAEDAGDLEPGDTIQAAGLLKDFEKPCNPGEFDSLSYYRSLGFHYAITLKDSMVVRKAHIPVYRYLLMIRDRIAGTLEHICTSEAGGIYQAMLLGEKSGLSAEIKELYSIGGISHILAISGLHIAVIGMGLYRIWRRLGGLRFSGIAAGAVMSLYVVMTGKAVSACRAVIMFVLQLFSFICGRSYDMLSAAAAALLLLLWQNPMYLFHSGCQLSFGAVFAIGMLYPLLTELTGADHSIYKTFLSGIAVSFVTFPILAWHFFEISPYSVLLNLIVIPCMSLVMLSGLLGGVIGLWSLWAGRFFVALGELILDGYEWLCRTAELLPGNRIITGRPELWVICLYYVLLAAGILGLKKWQEEKTKGATEGRKGNPVVLSAFLVCLTGILCIRPQQGFLVCFLDVSQGDGIYLETPKHLRILVDGGSADKKELYEDSLLPFLKYRGVRKLDIAIVTHADEDHVSGLKQLLREDRIEVGQLLLPEIDEAMWDEEYLELISLAAYSETEIGFLSAGDELSLGSFTIKCLHPYKGLYTEERNAYSTVLEISYNEFAMLLTGDLDRAGEQYLTEHQIREKKRYDVLKVAHHGSRYSTDEEFLDRVRAEHAVISCGRKNVYGHPHGETLQRLRNAGCEVLSTAEKGAVIFDGIE